MNDNLKLAISRGAFILSSITLFIILYEYGFKTSLKTEIAFHIVYLITLILGISSQFFRYRKSKQSTDVKVWIADGLLVVVMLIVFFTSLNFDLYAINVAKCNNSRN